MRRPLALLVITSVWAATVLVPSLHSHAPADHVHPGHHHGVAADHDHAPRGTANHTPALIPCDPAEHAVPFVLISASAAAFAEIHADGDAHDIVQPDRRGAGTPAVTDVRVHGPPPRAQVPSRAPPAITLA